MSKRGLSAAIRSWARRVADAMYGCEGERERARLEAVIGRLLKMCMRGGLIVAL